jgi:hypothetical protein
LPTIKRGTHCSRCISMGMVANNRASRVAELIGIAARIGKASPDNGVANASTSVLEVAERRCSPSARLPLDGPT